MTITDTEQNTPTSDLPSTDPLAQLRGYWEGLRADGAIPTRSQISPRGIEAALSCTFLIERVAPGIARFRIAGMNLVDFMGMEVRGLPFSSIFCPNARADLARMLEAVFQECAILTMDITAERGLARPPLSARMLALPLRNEHGNVTLALGCMALKGRAGRTPRRFEILDSSLDRLAPITPRLRTVSGFVPKLLPMPRKPIPAEGASDVAASKPARAPYLRLVE